MIYGWAEWKKQKHYEKFRRMPTALKLCVNFCSYLSKLQWVWFRRSGLGLHYQSLAIKKERLKFVTKAPSVVNAERRVPSADLLDSPACSSRGTCFCHIFTEEIHVRYLFRVDVFLPLRLEEPRESVLQWMAPHTHCGCLALAETV